MSKLNRRTFLRGTAVGALAAISPALIRCQSSRTPGYLQSYGAQYKTDPRAAARAWFAQARFGLFMHYGLYSMLGRGEWVMFHEKIPVAEYEKLAERFDPVNFDAELIADLAVDAGMKYVNLTAKHHDGFCLFDTGQSDYNSAVVAGRDLCGELAAACQKRGLGVFFYYSLAADWHHPYFLSRDYGRITRPDYKQPQPAYKFRSLDDFDRYVDYAQAHVRELLTQYGPVSGIWFDPFMGYFGAPQRYRIHQTYGMIRKLQPQCLISFKQGVTGDEDFAAPERRGHSMAHRVEQWFGKDQAAIAAAAWEKNKDKHNEICDTIQPGSWGYKKSAEGRHKTPGKVMAMLAQAAKQKCNLLLNTGPLPDGAIHGSVAKTLRAVGARLRREGFPPLA